MSTLGLCLIVKNEQNNLGRCLNSVAGIFDQVVVVDTGSTDDTCLIAAAHGAEVYDFTWIDDFSAARNFSFSKCRCDYICWLDADDILQPEDRQKLLELKQHLGSADAFLFHYNYAQNEFGQCIASLQRHRIVRNSPEVKWRWPIHECLDVPVSWRQQSTNITVTHKRSADDAAKDAGRNLRIFEKALRESPTEPRLRYYYARELYFAGKFDESLANFNTYYAQGGGWHDDLVNGRLLMASIYSQRKMPNLAIDQCLEAIKIDARWAEPYIDIGMVHYFAERWHQAIPWFEIASRLPNPGVLGVINPDYYTWVPHDRLCKCYSQIGMIREAYEANEIALSYRPADGRLQANREFLRNILYHGRQAERPIRLSLGSGGKQTISYRCTDLYPGPNIEELIDQGQIPYHDASIHAIYSEHALEHSAGHEAAQAALKEWARVLRYGGHLVLKVPDLDVCCREFAATTDRERLPNERWTPKEWYKYTIYGIQKGQNAEPDEGQYHRTGFTVPELKRLLQSNGFEVMSAETYDGYGTPSIKIEAVQVGKPVKVCWLLPGEPDYDHGSMRIRRLNVHKWLSEHGVASDLVNLLTDKDAFAKAKAANVCVFTSFGPREREMIDKLKRCGVKCIFDHCEDIHGLPDQNECFGAVDLITCCSTVLADKAAAYGRTAALFDAYETSDKVKDVEDE